MRKFGEHFLGAVALVVILSFVAIAGSFTINTTAAQDRKIHKMLTVENTRRAAQSPPQSALTTSEFFDVMFLKLFKARWRRQRRRLLRAKSQSELDNFVNP
jgi:hypothetical protein